MNDMTTNKDVPDTDIEPLRTIEVLSDELTDVLAWVKVIDDSEFEEGDAPYISTGLALDALVKAHRVWRKSRGLEG